MVHDLETINPKIINKTGCLPIEIETLVGTKLILLENIDVSKG